MVNKISQFKRLNSLIISGGKVAYGGYIFGRDNNHDLLKAVRAHKAGWHFFGVHFSLLLLTERNKMPQDKTWFWELTLLRRINSCYIQPMVEHHYKKTICQ